MWPFCVVLLAFMVEGIRDDVRMTLQESDFKDDGVHYGHSGDLTLASSLTASEQKIVTAAVRRLATGHDCKVVEDDALSMKLQSLLQALRSCLDARREWSAQTQETLKEEKKEGKIYAKEVTGIMNLIRRVQDSGRMEEPWKQDHYDALAQLLEKTSEAQKAAEMVWTEKKDS